MDVLEKTEETNEIVINKVTDQKKKSKNKSEPVTKKNKPSLVNVENRLVELSKEHQINLDGLDYFKKKLMAVDHYAKTTNGNKCMAETFNKCFRKVFGIEIE